MATKSIGTSIDGFTLRLAQPADVPLILQFIRELAAYERLANKCVATEPALTETLFGEHPYAEVVIGSYEGTPTSFALFFSSYSTFLARPGIYLEDLYVREEWRGRGFGGVLLEYVAHLAVERGCGRMEWSVLDWNVDAIRFYERLGARPLDDWTTMRLVDRGLAELGQRFHRK